MVLTKHPHRDRREIRGVRANTSHKIKLNTKNTDNTKHKPNILTGIKYNTRKYKTKTTILPGTPPCYKQFLLDLEEPEKSADAEK